MGLGSDVAVPVLTIFDPNQKSPTMILAMTSSPARWLSLHRKNPEKPAGPFFNFY